MIDKRKTTRLVKIISLFLAVTFVLSMIPLSGIGSGSSSSNRTATTSTPVEPQAEQVSNAEKVRVLIGQGEVSEKSQNWAQAVDFYSDATKLDSAAAEPFFLLGRSATKAEQTDLARTSLEKYLKMDPEGPYQKEAKELLSTL